MRKMHDIHLTLLALHSLQIYNFQPIAIAQCRASYVHSEQERWETGNVAEQARTRV